MKYIVIMHLFVILDVNMFFINVAKCDLERTQQNYVLEPNGVDNRLAAAW